MKKKVTFKLPPLGAQHAKQAINQQQDMTNNPVTKDQATQQITEIINKSKMPPSMLAQIGQLAENAINDKSKYKDFVDFMVSKKMEKREDLKKPDYQMLASIALIGKVAQNMTDNQQPTQPTEIVEPVVPTQGM